MILRKKMTSVPLPLSHPLAYRKSMKNKIPTTDIAFILDRSGSMAPLTKAAIRGFNELLHDQQQTEGHAWLTLVLFDDEYLVPLNHLPVCEVIELDATTYVPRSCTALLDAIGRTIVRFDERIASLPEGNRPDKVVFAIFTDGLENSSVEYTWKQISQMIRKHRKENGWEFLFLAANQDAVATASQMSINAHDTATWDGSASGVVGSSKAFSRKIRAMRMAESENGGDLSKSMKELLDEETENQ